MPRDPWEDDDDRRRRRRDDDDDYEDDFIDRRFRRAAQSGAVTAVGIINIIDGTLAVLGGLCLGVIWTQVTQNFRGGPEAGLMGIVSGVIVMLALLILVVGTLEIIAGVGVLNRKNWARILTLVLGGVASVRALLCAFFMISALNNTFADERTVGAVFFGLVVVFSIAYVILVYVVLLNPTHADECH